MKLPEYSLKRPVEIPSKNTNDVLTFPPGTLIRPFWNEVYVPEHIMKDLLEVRRYRLSKEQLVMCIIGTTWVPVEVSNIRTSQ